MIHRGPFLVGETGRYRVGSATVVNREASGIPASCLAIRKALYLEVGGLSEALPLNFGDVDLSLKVRRGGATGCCSWPAPTAYHFEARTRQPTVFPREARVLNRRWLLPNHDLYLPYLPESEPPRSATGRRARPRARARWQ